MSAFRTTFTVPCYPFKLSHRSTILSMGSCFAQVMAERMEQFKFKVTINPHGIIYNPLSLSHALVSYCESDHSLENNRIHEVDGIWHSFDHHGSISASSRKQLLRNIRSAYEKGRTTILQSDLIICTLGTSFVFQLVSQKSVVANCHKLPASAFLRKMATLEEMYTAMHQAFEIIRKNNPAVHFVLTVSPIRHLRDGMIENSVSKARLIELCHQLVETSSYCHYFPAYELMMDDLRDYRYYAADMIHPTEVAHDYIWHYFTSACIDEESRQIVDELTRLHKSLNHRPIYPTSRQHLAFVKATSAQLTRLKSIYPFLDLTWEDDKLAALH